MSLIGGPSGSSDWLLSALLLCLLSGWLGGLLACSLACGLACCLLVVCICSRVGFLACLLVAWLAGWSLACLVASFPSLNLQKMFAKKRKQNRNYHEIPFAWFVSMLPCPKQIYRCSKDCAPCDPQYWLQSSNCEAKRDPELAERKKHANGVSTCSAYSGSTWQPKKSGTHSCLEAHVVADHNWHHLV